MDPDDRSWLLEVTFDAQVRSCPLEVGRSYTVGRDDAADLRLPDRRISRRHCMLVPHEDRWRVVDLGSRRGITVNGVACKDHVLADGDEIRLSDRAHLRVVLDAPEAGPVPAGWVQVIPRGRPLRHRMPLVLLIVAVAGAGWWIGEHGLPRAPRGARTPRFDPADPERVLRDLALLAARPDPAALEGLIELDGVLQQPDGFAGADAWLRVETSRALLDVFGAAAGAGDARALDALAERVDRPGVVETLLGAGECGLAVVLAKVEEGVVSSERVVDHLARVTDTGAHPRLARLAFDDAQDGLLRAEALAVLADDRDLLPDAALRELVEAARADPWDRGAELLALRAARILGARDPDGHGALAEDLQARARARMRRGPP